MNGFIRENIRGQHVLRFDAGEFADIRLFMRGPLLDGTQGSAEASRVGLIPLLGEGERFPLIAPKQVHGTTILNSVKKNALPSLVEADGILLDLPDIEASLRFADCAPVVVASSEGKPWVLLMHSGYKGTVSNIVKAGLRKVRDRYGASALSSAFAWVGPCIGGANYPRNREEWTLRGLDVFHGENVRPEGEKVFFDIPAELRLQLNDAGLDKRRIFLSGTDTLDSRAFCYSYRGGDSEDRMFLWARFRENKMPQKIPQAG